MPTQELPGESGNQRDPFVSPLYAGLAGLPPLHIQAWSDETLLEDSRLFADQARPSAPTSAPICSPDGSTPSRWPVVRPKDADEAMRRPACWARPKPGR